MDTSFERHKGLLHKLSVKAFMRMQEVDPTITFEDIFQEMFIAFTKAQAGYDPNHGAAFTTYFGRTCWNEVMKLRHGLERTRQSLHYPVNLEALVEQDTQGSYHDFLADPKGKTPEQALSDTQQVRQKFASLSPYARAIVDVLSNPSESARAAYARQRDKLIEQGKHAPEEMTLKFIVDWLFAANQKNAIPLATWKLAKKELLQTYEFSRRA